MPTIDSLSSSRKETREAWVGESRKTWRWAREMMRLVGRTGAAGGGGGEGAGTVGSWPSVGAGDPGIVACGRGGSSEIGRAHV